MIEIEHKRYTMRQIAELAGVSKIKVYRYIKANNISEVEVNGQALLYDETAKTAIIEGLSEKHETAKTETKTTSEPNHEMVKEAVAETDYSELIAVKDQQIAQLNEQLERQDQQMLKQLTDKQKTIDNLNDNLKSMNKLMDQQQQLQLATQKQLENERARIGILKEGASDRDEQLLAKDRQIIAKDNQINELHELLDQQHKFNLSIQDQLDKADKQHSWMFWKNK